MTVYCNIFDILSQQNVYIKSIYMRSHLTLDETGLNQQITRRAPATRGCRHLNIYVCKILDSQRSSLIQHITARGGDWPPANDELVANYINGFSRFIKSINFQKLN
jgi:hypothetical protein